MAKKCEVCNIPTGQLLCHNCKVLVTIENDRPFKVVKKELREVEFRTRLLRRVLSDGIRWKA